MLLAPKVKIQHLVTLRARGAHTTVQECQLHGPRLLRVGLDTDTPIEVNALPIHVIHHAQAPGKRVVLVEIVADTAQLPWDPMAREELMMRELWLKWSSFTRAR